MEWKEWIYVSFEELFLFIQQHNVIYSISMVFNISFNGYDFFDYC